MRDQGRRHASGSRPTAAATPWRSALGRPGPANRTSARFAQPRCRGFTRRTAAESSGARAALRDGSAVSIVLSRLGSCCIAPGTYSGSSAASAASSPGEVCACPPPAPASCPPPPRNRSAGRLRYGATHRCTDGATPCLLPTTGKHSDQAKAHASTTTRAARPDILSPTKEFLPQRDLCFWKRKDLGTRDMTVGGEN